MCYYRGMEEIIEEEGITMEDASLILKEQIERLKEKEEKKRAQSECCSDSECHHFAASWVDEGY